MIENYTDRELIKFADRSNPVVKELVERFENCIDHLEYLSGMCREFIAHGEAPPEKDDSKPDGGFPVLIQYQDSDVYQVLKTQGDLVANKTFIVISRNVRL